MLDDETRTRYIIGDPGVPARRSGRRALTPHGLVYSP